MRPHTIVLGQETGQKILLYLSMEHKVKIETRSYQYKNHTKQELVIHLKN